MGKRKRRAEQNKTPPDHDTHSPHIDALPEQKSSHQVGSSGIKLAPTIMDSIDKYVEVSQGNRSSPHHQHNCSRSVLLKHSRHYYSRHYSRRSSCNYAEASTSQGKGTPLRDEKLYFKLSSKHNAEFPRHTESRDRVPPKPEKIKRNVLPKDAATSDSMRLVCGICDKLLRKKPYTLDNTTSTNDLSVVAVLVCGHAYHADCLEQRTCYENRRDPPCPACAGLPSGAESSVALQ